MYSLTLKAKLIMTTDINRVRNEVVNQESHNCPLPNPIILITSFIRVSFSFTTDLTIIPTDNIQPSDITNGNIYSIPTRKLEGGGEWNMKLLRGLVLLLITAAPHTHMEDIS